MEQYIRQSTVLYGTADGSVNDLKSGIFRSNSNLKYSYLVYSLEKYATVFQT